MNEPQDVPLEEIVPEPEHKIVEKSERTINLKFSGVADYAKYEVDSETIHFLPTMMFTSRSHTFRLKNVSLINLNYRCKVVHGENGIPDTGYYGIYPKMGTIAPNCDD